MSEYQEGFADGISSMVERIDYLKEDLEALKEENRILRTRLNMCPECGLTKPDHKMSCDTR